MFTYCLNNPIRLTDPTGTIASWAAVLEYAAIAAGGAIKGLKHAASAVVAVSSGIYAGTTTEGTTGLKIATGVVTGIVAGVGTYFGTGIDTKSSVAFASGFASFAATAFVGTPTEIVSVFAQKITSSLSGLFS